MALPPLNFLPEIGDKIFSGSFQAGMAVMGKAQLGS